MTSPLTTRSWMTALAAGERLYSAAYIMPPPPLGEARKHSNHLRLMELMMRDRAPAKVAEAASMAAAFDVLAGYPGIGAFLAYQYLIDLNYAAGLGFSEMEFVVPGPGRGMGSASASARPLRHRGRGDPLHGRCAGGAVRAARPGVRGAARASAAADRLPEPVLRGRQVRPRCPP